MNRRFFLTQKARDAHVYGILVSNLSQQHLVEVVKSLKQRIQDAGKASYSFAVGKINPAKLANFAEIDIFVLVACREHSLLSEEREYPVPVITPLELDIALGNLTWGAQAYSLDCQDVLGYSSTDKAEMESDVDGDAPYFSLATGKYVKPTGTSEAPLELEHLPGKGQVTAYKSEAADFLKQREYQGLSTLAGQTEVKAAVVGQRGIASDYGGS
jgi:diphthamide biosynthesis protein 2